MMETAQPIDGVKLTSLTINAASPDVIGSLLKQITEQVLAQIPAEAITKIASEALSGGKLVTKRVNRQYGGDEVTTYSLTEDANAQLGRLLTEEVKRQVGAYMDEESTKQLVGQLVAQGIESALGQVATLAAHTAAQRLGSTMMGSWEVSKVLCDVDQIRGALKTTQSALIQKGLITPYDAGTC